MSAHDDDPFQRIERATQALARRVLWEQGNRIGLLRVHAAVGILAGVQILAFGSAASIEALVGVGVRMLLGVLGVLGGSLLWWGLRKSPRSITLEGIGLALLGIWDLTMTLGLAWARAHSTSFGLKWPWVRLPPPEDGFVVPYPIAVYGGMFALIVIHLLTLRKFKKAGAPPAKLVKEEG